MCVSTLAQGAASSSDYGVLVAVTHSTVHIRSVLMTLTYVTVCSVVMTSRIWAAYTVIDVTVITAPRLSNIYSITSWHWLLKTHLAIITFIRTYVNFSQASSVVDHQSRDSTGLNIDFYRLSCILHTSYIDWHFTQMFKLSKKNVSSAMGNSLTLFSLHNIDML